MNFFILLNCLGIFLVFFTIISIRFKFGKKVKCVCSKNLLGKTILITGGSDGIGKEAAKRFAKMGARVLITGRNSSKCIAAVDEIREFSGNLNADYYSLDLSDMSSVRACAEAVVNSEPCLHVVVNNAGIGYHKSAKTADGYDTIFATNYLGHFLWTVLLLGLLRRSGGARIVNVTSISQRLNPKAIDFSTHVCGCGDEVLPRLSGYDVSKLALALFTRELSARVAAWNITVNAVHPGIVAASRVWSEGYHIMPGWVVNLRAVLLRLVSVSATVASSNLVHAALASELDSVTGRYLENCRLCSAEHAQVRDATARATLWRLSELLVGLTPQGGLVPVVPRGRNDEAGPSMFDYLTRKKQKPVTSPEAQTIDRRQELPAKSWLERMTEKGDNADT